MSYFVYILANKRNGTLYTGMTNSLSRRIEEHKLGIGATFPAKHGCTLLVHAERFDTAQDAMRRERAIKRYHRKWKLDLIEKENPGWEDLSYRWL
ncbi:MAG: GIY-YIG nuclease family protein [Pseudomonadota bacterium]